MAKIFAPNKAYNGETASVHFASGTGETENSALLAWFSEHGYTVEDTSTEQEAEMTDLAKRCEALKLDLPDGLTVDQVREAVEKAEQEAQVLDYAEKEKKAAK